MYLLPFRKITKETTKSYGKVRTVLEKICILPTRLDIQQFVDYRVLEYEISSDQFMILMGRYGLSYGITNLAPVLHGKFLKDSSGKNKIEFIIRPKWAGLVTIALLTAIAAFGLIVSIQRNQLQGIITSSVFMIIAYWAIISRFNKEMKHYNKVMEDVTS